MSRNSRDSWLLPVFGLLLIGCPGTAECPSGTTDCDGTCVATPSDPMNCGSCGNACAAGEVCSVGMCASECGSGTTECAGMCTNTNVDPMHCGSCGTTCDAGELCSGGACGLSCGGGTMLCGTACADTAIDRSNCGGCGNVCGDGQICEAGSCVTACGGTACENGEHIRTLYWGTNDMRIFRVETDSEDNVIVSGRLVGTLNLGGNDLNPGSTASTAFLAKFDRDGNHIWSFTYGGGIARAGYGLAIDSADNIIVGGYFRNSTIAFPGGGTYTANADGDFDAYLVKFNAGGVHQWSKLIGAGTETTGRVGDQYVADLAIDSADNIIVVGSGEGTLDFGGGVRSAGAGNNIFVAKLTPTGSHIFSGVYGDDLEQGAYSVDVDGADNMVIAGYMQGSANFSSDPNDAITNTGVYNTCLAKLDSTGNHVWSRIYGEDATTDQGGHHVRLDAADNIFLAGIFQGNMDLGGGAVSANGGWDGYIARFDASGVEDWTNRLGLAEDQWLSKFALDAAGNPYGCGYFEGTIDFGGNPANLVTSSTTTDAAVIAMDGESGGYRWAEQFGDSTNDDCSDIVIDGNGRVIIVGNAQGAITLGATTYQYSGPADGYAGFVAWLAP